MKKKTALFLSFLGVLFLAAKAKPPVKPIESNPLAQNLLAVEEKYTNSEAVQMKVKKSLKLAHSPKLRNYEGDLYIKKNGRLRLELNGIPKSLLVVSNEAVWIVDEPMDSSEKTRVIVSKAPKKLQSQPLLAFLLGRGKILDSFKVVDKVIDSDKAVYILHPKEEVNIKNLSIQVNEKEKIIQTISYWDNLNSETRFEFSSVDFDKKLSDQLFKYTPPKDAVVTEER